MDKIRKIIFQLFSIKSKRQGWENVKDYGFEKICPEKGEAQLSFVERNFFPLLTKKSRVLSVGCGNGWFDFKVSPYVGHIDAYDLSTHLIDLAKKEQKKIGRTNILFAQKDFLKLHITEKYDAILCMGLFPCITKPEDFSLSLTKVHSLLEKNGLLLTRESLVKWEGEQFEQPTMWDIVYRKEKDYIKTVQNNGFSLIKKSYITKPTSDSRGYCIALFLFRKNF